jgi:hypothetical protein
MLNAAVMHAVAYQRHPGAGASTGLQGVLYADAEVGVTFIIFGYVRIVCRCYIILQRF